MTNTRENRERAVTRPALTAPFVGGCAFWLGTAVSYLAEAAADAGSCTALSLAALAAGLATGLLLCHLRRFGLAVLATSFLLGGALGAGQAAAVHFDLDGEWPDGQGSMTITLLEDTRETAAGESCFAEVEARAGAPVTAYVSFKDETPKLCGTRLDVAGFASPADFPRDDYLWGHGASARITVRSCEEAAGSPLLSTLTAARREALGVFDFLGEDRSEIRALLKAIVCGYRHDLYGTSLYSKFQTCGLAHLVAVSGAHLVIVTSLLAAALRALHAPRRLSIVLLIFLMGSYFIVSGMPVSALRATVMSSIAILSLFGGRRPSALNALGLAMFGLILVSPTTAVSSSFVLSSLSTAGIVIFGPLMLSWLDATALPKAPLIGEALAMTLSSNLLAQLFGCSLFHQLSLVSVLANIVCAPLFPLTCGLGLVAALGGSVFEACAPAFAYIAAIAASCLAYAVRALSEIPLAAIPIAISGQVALSLSFAVAAALWICWPKLKITHAAVALASAILIFGLQVTAASSEDAIVMLDVGQGDSFLVRSGRQALLIDTGKNDSQLLEQLALCGTYRLDAVLITHADDDHCGSLDALERAVSVGQVVLPGGMQECDDAACSSLVDAAQRCSNEIVEVNRGDSFSIGSFECAVVWPEELLNDGGNADSLCLYVRYDGNGDGASEFTALFTGDAEAEQLDAVIEQEGLANVDVIKVGHHGSKNAMTPAEVKRLSPKVALIGVGEGNRYGHPSDEIIQMLAAVGCRTFRTDEDGQVKLVFTNQRMDVYS